MTRRARVSWLLSTGRPTGRAVMAVRRMNALAGRYDTAGFTLEPLPRLPRHSALRALAEARSLAGEARLARSDVVVTTNESSVASAVSRAAPGVRIVHLVHDHPDFLLGTVRFMRSLPRVSHVVVPMSVDPVRFAERAGIDIERVSVLDDFVPETESLLAPGTGRVALLAGRLGTAGAPAVEAFDLVRDELPGWQLRLLGHDRAVPELSERVEAAGLRGRVVVAGPSYDIAPHYLDAGAVLALDADDVNGLSVYEGLAAGVPVLGSAQVPAVGRLVRDGHNGVVLDRTDPVAIAEGLVRLASAAPELAAAARAERSGLLTAAAERELLHVFSHVLDQPAPRRGRP